MKIRRLKLWKPTVDPHPEGASHKTNHSIHANDADTGKRKQKHVNNINMIINHCLSLLSFLSLLLILLLVVLLLSLLLLLSVLLLLLLLVWPSGADAGSLDCNVM